MSGSWAFRKQTTNDKAGYWMVWGWEDFSQRTWVFGFVATISKNMQGGNKLVVDKQRDGVLMTSRPCYVLCAVALVGSFLEAWFMWHDKLCQTEIQHKFILNGPWGAIIFQQIQYNQSSQQTKTKNTCIPLLCISYISLSEFHCFPKSIKSISEPQWCAKWSIPSI